MKPTMEIPDELYRQEKVKSAPEGRPLREPGGGEPRPSWFGALRKRVRRVQTHDIDSIRESIARGLAAERGR